jgi:hypothetical protein
MNGQLVPHGCLAAAAAATKIEPELLETEGDSLRRLKQMSVQIGVKCRIELIRTILSVQAHCSLLATRQGYVQ